MRSIARLFGAFGTLADSVLSLASVLDVATARLRLTLAAEVPEQLTHGSSETEISQPDANGAIPEPSPSTKRKARV